MILTVKKRPIRIRAVLLEQNETSIIEVLEFMGYKEPTQRMVEEVIGATGVIIETHHGVALAAWGDYVMEGIDGENYPCKPDVFQTTYMIEEKPIWINHS